MRPPGKTLFKIIIVASVLSLSFFLHDDRSNTAGAQGLSPQSPTQKAIGKQVGSNAATNLPGPKTKKGPGNAVNIKKQSSSAVGNQPPAAHSKGGPSGSSVIDNTNSIPKKIVKNKAGQGITPGPAGKKAGSNSTGLSPGPSIINNEGSAPGKINKNRAVRGVPPNNPVDAPQPKQ